MILNSNCTYMYPFHLPFPSHPGNMKESDKQARIAAGEVTPVERYYFSLPTARAHTSHKVPEFPRPGGWGYCMHRHN